jgi:hypothetical protein
MYKKFQSPKLEMIPSYLVIPHSSGQGIIKIYLFLMEKDFQSK